MSAGSMESVKAKMKERKEGDVCIKDFLDWFPGIYLFFWVNIRGNIRLELDWFIRSLMVMSTTFCFLGTIYPRGFIFATKFREETPGASGWKCVAGRDPGVVCRCESHCSESATTCFLPPAGRRSLNPPADIQQQSLSGSRNRDNSPRLDKLEISVSEQQYGDSFITARV